MLPKVKAVPMKPSDEYAVMKPTQPEEPPPDRFGNFIISDPKQLMDIKGSAYDMFADTLLVRCSDEGLWVLQELVKLGAVFSDREANLHRET